MFVGLAVRSRPLRKGGRPESQPAEDLGLRDFDLSRPIADVVDNFVTLLMGNPATIQGFPRTFFSLTCSLQEFHDDFVFGLDLHFHLFHLPFRGRILPALVGDVLFPFEADRSVLEQWPLPVVEVEGTDAVLITEVRDGNLFEKVFPHNCYFLFSR